MSNKQVVPEPSPEAIAEEQQSRRTNSILAGQAADSEKLRRVYEQQKEEEEEQQKQLEERLRQSQLADAVEDGERQIRITSQRFERDLEDLSSKNERVQALEDAKRTIELERAEAAQNQQLDLEDTLESERHQRRASVQLAINLAEEERLRRIAELEREKLAALEEELEERHHNQRIATEAVEAERKRRLMENPLGSPFARPDTKNRELTPEQLEEELRQASSLLATELEKNEKATRVHELQDEDRFVATAESIERSLNQRSVDLQMEIERARRVLEDEENNLAEARERRHNIARAKSAVDTEQNARITNQRHELIENEYEEERLRREAQLRALEQQENERQDQISHHVRRTSQPIAAR